MKKRQFRFVYIIHGLFIYGWKERILYFQREGGEEEDELKKRGKKKLLTRSLSLVCVCVFVIHFGWTGYCLVFYMTYIVSSCQCLGWALSGIVVVCRFIYTTQPDNVSDIDQCTTTALAAWTKKKEEKRNKRRVKCSRRKSTLIREDISFLQNYIYISQKLSRCTNFF